MLAEVHPPPCRVSDLTDWAEDVGEGIDDILSFVGAFVITHSSEGDVVVSYHRRPELAEQAAALVFMFEELDAKLLTSFLRKTFPKSVFTEASLSIALALDSRLARLPDGGYAWQDSADEEEPAEDALQKSLARLDIAPLELKNQFAWGILGSDGLRWIAAPGAARAPDPQELDKFLATPLSSLNLRGRTYNALTRNRIHTVGEVLARSGYEIMKLDFFGQQSWRDLLEHLRSLVSPNHPGARCLNAFEESLEDPIGYQPPKLA
jgi:hypothetical protein